MLTPEIKEEPKNKKAIPPNEVVVIKAKEAVTDIVITRPLRDLD
jgi:hypothetical protein